jgi:hypothetical protein
MSLKLFDLLPQSSMLLFEVTMKTIEAESTRCLRPRAEVRRM